jgi:hypothetical protein
MWDPEDANRRVEAEGYLYVVEIKLAEEIGEKTAKGPIGAQIRKLFQTKDMMGGTMQAMDLTRPHFQAAFRACHDVDDDVPADAVRLGLIMNLVLILQVVKTPPAEILDMCSRAIELTELFKESMVGVTGRDPFEASGGDQ